MLNQCQFIGNLGRDPETRTFQNGNKVANLRIAVTEKWKDKNSGELREKTEWHRVVVWGKQAENVSQYLAKGRAALVEGRLQTRKWQGQDGQDRYTTEIVGNEMQMLDSRGGGSGQQQPPQQPYQQHQQHQQQPAQPQQSGGGYDDDIPFAPVHPFA